MLSDFVKERIGYEIIKIINRKFDDFPELTSVQEIRNAPFHESFLNAFRHLFNSVSISTQRLISLSSWQHGLNTSLGTFFENVAHILSNGEKRKFTNLFVTSVQQERISSIITKLKSEGNPNFTQEESEIFELEGDATVGCPEFTADNYVEDVDAIEVIEIKTVRPNSGEMKGEKQKILYGKASIKKQNPTKNVSYFIGFPFDPTSDDPTSYNKSRFKDYLIETKKFFADDEILLASELWDHLSGSDNTMEEILEIINNIANPQFYSDKNFISDFSNFEADPIRFKNILSNWNLKRELSVIEKIEENNSLLGNKRLRRSLNRKPFYSDGKYNLNRLDSMLEIADI